MSLLPFCMVVGGLLLLVLGGEVLLRGAVSLADRLGLSSLLIGMTVVAAATSMPELVVAVASGLEGAPDIGVGNAVGSNIANILLILGTAALLYPIATRPRHVLRDGMAMMAGTLIFALFALMGTIGWIDGLVMLALLTAYVTYSYQRDRQTQTANGGAPVEYAVEGGEDTIRRCSSIWLCLALVAGGVALLVVGSKLLVEGAVDLARAAGISEAVIGLTLVAVGTSLPELATAVVAGLRRHPEVAIGNVLGSNLFNLLAIIPALALTIPFDVAPEILGFDLWVMIGVTVIALAAMLTGWRVGRFEGAGLLGLYVIYIAVLFGRGHMV